MIRWVSSGNHNKHQGIETEAQEYAETIIKPSVCQCLPSAANHKPTVEKNTRLTIFGMQHRRKQQTEIQAKDTTLA